MLWMQQAGHGNDRLSNFHGVFVQKNSRRIYKINMIVTITKINRKESVSKKTGKPFQQLGIAPLENTLIDINGDSFEREDRWLSGFGKSGVTDNWVEGDKVKINLVRVKGVKRDGTMGEFINFQLPVGVDPMIEKFSAGGEYSVVSVDGDANDDPF